MASQKEKEDVNAADGQGRTALHFACEEGDLNQVKLLIRKKAFVNVQDKNWWSPLHCAASKKYLQIVRYLLREGADPTVITNTRTSALHYVARLRDEDLEGFQPGSVKPIPKGGDKAKDIAAFLESSQVANTIKTLMDAGADVNSKNATGATPLHEAAYKGSEVGALALLRYQAKLDVKDKYGETALHYAVRAGHKDVVLVLLESGADPEIKGQRGTAEEVGGSNEIKTEIQKLLQEYTEKKQEANRNNDLSPNQDVLCADRLERLPRDLREAIEKAGIDPQVCENNFPVLTRIFDYLYKKKVIHTDIAASSLFKKGDPTKVYKKIDSSGQGGFGKVFLAKNVENKLTVAVKRISHISKKERFRNLAEIIFLKSFDHPNILRYAECYEWKDELWIVTEFMEGGTLKEAIAVRKFTEGDISYIARQVLKALHYLHCRHIVHRDIKSSNIMLSVNGDVKIIDFGLTVDISKNPTNHTAGSAHWMAPEVVLHKQYTCSADIWSFGLTLLECANRETPFKSPLRAMLSVATGWSPCLDNPESWSTDFRSFLAACLAHDPTRRMLPEALYKLPFITKGPTREAFINSVHQIFIANTFPGV